MAAMVQRSDTCVIPSVFGFLVWNFKFVKGIMFAASVVVLRLYNECLAVNTHGVFERLAPVFNNIDGSVLIDSDRVEAYRP